MKTSTKFPMRLTAKLALSQLKINRRRSIWTLLGIALSAAMVTAVCSFVVSGYAMALGFAADLGGDASEVSIVLIPLIGLAAIISAIVVSASVIVVSNSFRVSAGERAAQFGILKSVGATKKQIAASVMYESLFLSAVGIPIGIILGLSLAFAGVHTANYYMTHFNNLTDMMINEVVFVFRFVVAWQALLAAAAVAFITVLLSAWFPARRAAKVSAIDSIRGTGEVRIRSKQVRTGRLIQKLFKFEGTLAAKSLKRSRRNFRASVVSLTIGIVLFVTVSSISGQVGAVADMFTRMPASVMVDYFTGRTLMFNEERDAIDITINAPIDSETANTAAARLRQFEDTPIFGLSSDWVSYAAVIPYNAILEADIFADFFNESLDAYVMTAELIAVDPLNYAILSELAGVPLGSNILLNHHRHNEAGRISNITPFDSAMDSVLLERWDGTTREIPIHGMLAASDVPDELTTLNPPPRPRIIVPYIPEAIRVEWFANPGDIEGFMAYAEGLMGEMFPRDEDSLFTTRVFRPEDLMAAITAVTRLISIFVYVFVAMLTLIGLTNVISTISANVRMRAREFAVLKSVGMTYVGLKRMLNLESIMASAKSLFIGLPIAAALTYLAHRFILFSFEITYSPPIPAIIQAILAVFLITWVTMRITARYVIDGNIIETIRREN